MRYVGSPAADGVSADPDELAGRHQVPGPSAHRLVEADPHTDRGRSGQADRDVANVESQAAGQELVDRDAQCAGEQEPQPEPAPPAREPAGFGQHRDGRLDQARTSHRAGPDWAIRSPAGARETLALREIPRGLLV